jgi:RNA polymerase sigma factor (sigma-70 family)
MRVVRAAGGDRRGADREATVADERSSGSARFERLVLPHLDAAYTLARYLTHDAADAEDAVQEAVLRAIRYFKTLKAETDARPWLLAIVRRECYDLNGARRRTMSELPYEEAPTLQLVDPGPSPESETDRRLIHGRVLAAVALLPDHLRETVILREIQQCSYEEIAFITEAPIGTVMSRLSRARARLADTLRDVVDVGEGA